MTEYVKHLGLRLVNFKLYQMAVALKSNQVEAVLKSNQVGAILKSDQVEVVLKKHRKFLLTLFFLSSRAQLKLFLIQCPFNMPEQVEQFQLLCKCRMNSYCTHLSLQRISCTRQFYIMAVTAFSRTLGVTHESL